MNLASINEPTATFTNSSLKNLEVTLGKTNLISNSSTVTNLTLHTDVNVDADSSSIITNVSISKNAKVVTLITNVQNVNISSSNEIKLAGTGNIHKVTLEKVQSILLETVGSIDSLDLLDQQTTMAMGRSTKVINLSLPSGKSVSDIITDYNEIKENITNIEGTGHTEPPSGNSLFIGNPIVSTSTQPGSLDISFTSSVSGTYYAYFFDEAKGLNHDTLIQAIKDRNFKYFINQTLEQSIGNTGLQANKPVKLNTFTVTNYPINATKSYDVYVIVMDRDGNYEAVVTNDVAVKKGTKDAYVSNRDELKTAIYDPNIKDIYLKSQMVFSEDSEVFNGRGKTLISDTGSSVAPILVTGKFVSLNEFSLIGSQSTGWIEKDNGIQYDENSRTTLIDINISQP